MRFKPKPNPFRAAIKKAMSQELDENGREALRPFIAELDKYSSYQEQEWFVSCRPTEPIDMVGIRALLDECAKEKSDTSFGVTVYKTWFGSSIAVTMQETPQKPTYIYDRINLNGTSVIEASLFCHLAHVNHEIASSALVLPEPNKFWTYHPERMRCSRLHLRELNDTPSSPDKKDLQELSYRYLFSHYRLWLNLRTAPYSDVMFGIFGDRYTQESYRYFNTFGRHIYSLSPSVADLLKKTDVHDIETTDIRTPHIAFYIHFGPQEDIVDINNRPLEGVYVVDVGDEIVFNFVFEDIVDDDVQHWIIGRDKSLQIDIKREGSVGQAMDASIKDMIAGLDKARAESEENDGKVVYGDESDEKSRSDEIASKLHSFIIDKSVGHIRDMAHLYSSCMALAINSIFYITAFEDDSEISIPEVKLSNGRRAPDLEDLPHLGGRKNEALAQEGFIVVRHIGRSVKPSSVLEGSQDSARRAHWRRGFWRMQRVGPNRAEQRLTWVRPTMVNGTDSPVARLGVIHKVTDR